MTTTTTTKITHPSSPFTSLPHAAVSSLARILTIPSGPSARLATRAACDARLAAHAALIADLARPSPLLRRSTARVLGAALLRRGGGGGDLTEPEALLRAEQAASLCGSHGGLSAAPLAALMGMVAEECAGYTDRYRYWRDRKARRRLRGEIVEDDGEGMNAAVEFWLESITRISALWMGKKRWEADMRRELEGNFRIPYCARRWRCVACKLSVVGGSPQFLADLRTSLLARRAYALDVKGITDDDDGGTGDLAPPPLLRMVEAWIEEGHDEDMRRKIRRESGMLAPMVVALRVRMSKERERRGVRVRKSEERVTGEGWMMPLAAVGEGGDDDGEEEEEEEKEAEVGYSRLLRGERGRGRRREGGSVSRAKSSESLLRRGDEEQTYIPPLRVPTTTTTDTKQNASGDDDAGEPWSADYKRYILSSGPVAVPPASTAAAGAGPAHNNRQSEARLSSIYDAYAHTYTGIAPTADVTITTDAAATASSPSSVFPPTTRLRRDEQRVASETSSSSVYDAPPQPVSPLRVRKGKRPLRRGVMPLDGRTGEDDNDDGDDDDASVRSVSSTVLMGTGAERRWI